MAWKVSKPPAAPNAASAPAPAAQPAGQPAAAADAIDDPEELVRRLIQQAEDQSALPVGKTYEEFFREQGGIVPEPTPAPGTGEPAKKGWGSVNSGEEEIDGEPEGDGDEEWSTTESLRAKVAAQRGIQGPRNKRRKGGR